MRVQRKVCITWNREIIHSEGVERLGGFNLIGSRASISQLLETIRDEKNENDQETVCGALDLEVAKERVGTE